MKKSDNIITALGIAFIFMLIFNNGSSSEINNLENNINSLENRISELELKLEEEEQGSKLLNSINFKIQSSDNKNLVSKVKVNIELNRLSKNSYPVFAFKEWKSEEWKEVELENNKALSYNTTIDLNQKKNYEYKVYTKGEVVESTTKEMIAEQYYTGNVYNWSSEGSSKGGFLVSVYDPYSKELASIEDLRIKNIYVEVKSGSKVEKHKLTKEKGSDTYNLELKQKDLPKEYTSYLVAEYNNGLVKKYKIHNTSYE